MEIDDQRRKLFHDSYPLEVTFVIKSDPRSTLKVWFSSREAFDAEMSSKGRWFEGIYLDNLARIRSVLVDKADISRIYFGFYE